MLSNVTNPCIFSDLYLIKVMASIEPNKIDYVNHGFKSTRHAPINISFWGSSHVKFPGFKAKVGVEFENFNRSFPGKFKLGKVFGKSGAEWGRHRDSDLVDSIKEYAFNMCAQDDYNGQIIVIVLGSNDARRINPNGLYCVNPHDELKFGNLNESFDMYALTKMHRRIEDLLTVLSGCSGIGVVLCNTVLVYETQLSFVNNMFQNFARKYSNTKCSQIKIGPNYFNPDRIHLNERGIEYLIKYLFNQCKFMPLKLILS